MKKLLIVLSLTFFCVMIGNSQNKNKERIKLLKVSFITEALDLSPSEAEKFWPVYNDYTNKIQRLKRQLDSSLQVKSKDTQGFDTISEEDAKNLLSKSVQLENNIARNKTAMTKDLSEFISAKKLLKLQRAERDFNRQMLQEFGRRKRLQKSKD